MLKRSLFAVLFLALATGASTGCDSDDSDADALEPTASDLAVVESDASASATATRLTDALDAAGPVSIVADVNHAANASSVGLDLRPTRVVLFGNPALGTPIMQANQQAGIDLPQKMLVYEDAGGRVGVAYNTTDYLAARHGVGDVETLDQISGALGNFAAAASGSEADPEVGNGSVSEGAGLVRVESDADAETTFGRLRSAVEGNDALTIVAELDHAANAASVDMELRPTKLLVFGNPNLGTPLMQAEQTIGIDLPQKVLVYTDAEGTAYVLYNDPVYLADRYGAEAVEEQTTAISNALANLAATAAGQ